MTRRHWQQSFWSLRFEGWFVGHFWLYCVIRLPLPPPTPLPLLVLMGMLGQIRNCSRDWERIFPKFYFYPNLRYWVTANWFPRFSLPRNLCSLTSNYNHAAWNMIVRCMGYFNFIHDHSRSVGEWPRNSWTVWDIFSMFDKWELDAHFVVAEIRQNFHFHCDFVLNWIFACQ